MVEFMAYVILGMGALAIFHFIYTGIILPSLRFRLRLELFRLRDELREIQISDENKLSPEVFEVLQTLINNTVNLLPRLNAALVHNVTERINSDPVLRHQVDKRLSMIQASNDDRVRRIDLQVGKIISKALRYNMMPLFVYLIPLVIVVWFFGQLAGQIKQISAIPEQEIDHVLPHDVSAGLPA
ncbi:MAG: hypothetical protein AB7P14_02320 [Blastocatellales bacterium]